MAQPVALPYGSAGAGQDNVSVRHDLTVADDPFRHVRLSPGAARYDQAYPP